jgi:hypothetical protein
MRSSVPGSISSPEGPLTADEIEQGIVDEYVVEPQAIAKRIEDSS